MCSFMYCSPITMYLILISFSIHSKGSLSAKNVDMKSLALLGSYKTQGTPYNIYVDNNAAYIADRESGLQIVDVSSPSNMFLMSSYDTPNDAVDVIVRDHIAYVADYHGGLLVLDVTNSSNPIFVSNFDTPGWAFEVTLNNDTAYIADGESGLEIITILDLNNPSLIGNYDTVSYAHGITIIDDIAYLAAYEDGVLIINVTNGSNPTLLSKYYTFGYAQKIRVVNNVAYVANWDGGVLILNVTDPSNPIFISNFTWSGILTAYDLFIINDVIYVTDPSNGLAIIDVSNLSFPSLIGNYSTPRPYGIKIVNDLIYIADFEAGLLVMEFLSSSFSEPSGGLFITFYLIIIIIPSLLILLIIFIFIHKPLLYLSKSYYDVYYLFFPLLGIFNFISDCLLISYAFILNNFTFAILALSFFVLSIILSYFRSIKWKKFLMSQKNDKIYRYLLIYSHIFNYIFQSSIIIHPSLLFILKCNLNNSFQFPISGNAVSIPIQCILHDFYSMPLSIILYLISFSDMNWDIWIWILILLKLPNSILSLSRVIAIVYYGGGKSIFERNNKIHMKHGLFQTVRIVPPPGLISLTETMMERSYNRPSLFYSDSFTSSRTPFKPILSSQLSTIEL